MSACSLFDSLPEIAQCNKQPVINNNNIEINEYLILNNCKSTKENKKMTGDKQKNNKTIDIDSEIDQDVETIETNETILESSNCGNCFHIEQGAINKADLLNTKYFCRRFPPVSVVLPAQNQAGGIAVQVTSMYPMIQKSDFCGEWEET